jgi:hypothetical protein
MGHAPTGQIISLVEAKVVHDPNHETFLFDVRR